jgi:hypothetical protein
MLECLDPPGGFAALLSYASDDPRRSWVLGSRFKTPPPTPVAATLQLREGSRRIELWSSPLPVMTRRLHEALLRAGVANLDTYPAELTDPESGAVYTDYVAFNIIGCIAAADLGRSKYDAPDGTMTSVDFDSLVIDAGRARGARMFRLAEAVNGIVVHASVKSAIEAAGIDTLTFMEPKDWTG